ncbi:MAG: tat (twin-arginine translocation) pathway signal sequence, partial [Sutterella sp.]|nr:tat (twin-arginine translocation) pathway signal sequence [Sutterella sp.]
MRTMFHIRLTAAAAAALIALTAHADAGKERGMLPLGQTSFAAYAEDARIWVAEHRPFVTEDRAFELTANLPREYRPAVPDGRGVLLVHGLGDSPWSFSDLAASLAAEGLLVRTVLLPG